MNGLNLLGSQAGQIAGLKTPLPTASKLRLVSSDSILEMNLMPLFNLLNPDTFSDSLTNQLELISIHVDGTVAYVVIGLSLLLGIIPASGLFLGQMTGGFFLIAANFVIQWLVNQGAVTPAMMQSVIIDIFFLGLGLYCASAITNNLISWFVGVTILVCCTLVFGLPSAIARCAGICSLAFIRHYI